MIIDHHHPGCPSVNITGDFGLVTGDYKRSAIADARRPRPTQAPWHAVPCTLCNLLPCYPGSSVENISEGVNEKLEESPA